MAFPLGDTVALQQELCDNGTKITSSADAPDAPTIYQINLGTPIIDKRCKIRRYHIGSPQDAQLALVEEKVLLMVGETGSGKSATINSIANHVFRVKADNNFRFRLVDENPDDDEHESQTEWVTAYTLHYQRGFNSKVRYTLTLVDTPGYGATQGPERDLEITKQMKGFFVDESRTVGCEYLSAICFVTQATVTRLSKEKIAIFKALLDLFAKDLANNILHIFTFAGHQTKPKALKVLKPMREIPLEKWYLIDNVALETEDVNEEVFEKTTKSLCNIFIDLGGIIDTSVLKTKEILEERDCLQNNIRLLPERFRDTFFQLDTLHAYKKEVERAKKDTDDNKKVTVVERVKYSISNENGRAAINCKLCHDTCRFPGGILPWFIMMLTTRCSYCRCSRKHHESSEFHYERRLESKQENIIDIIKRYMDSQTHDESANSHEGAVGGATETQKLDDYAHIIDLLTRNKDGKSLEEIVKEYAETKGTDMSDEDKKELVERVTKYKEAMEQGIEAMDNLTIIEEEFQKTASKMKDQFKAISDSIRRLDEIAMRPAQIKETDLIDEEIKKQKDAADPRWEERVKILENFKRDHL